MTTLQFQPAPSPGPDKVGRSAMLITGAIISLLAISFLVGGSFAAWANGRKDDAGVLNSDPARLSTTGHALVTQSLSVYTGDLGPVAGQSLVGDLELTVAGTDAGREVFVGIGPSSAVSDYLAEVAYTTVLELELSPFNALYLPHEGSAPVGAPESQTFWTQQATDRGTIHLTWPIAEGDWSVVFMNADGSPVVDVSVTVGATVPILGPIAVALFIAGGFGLIAGVVLIVIPLVKRRTTS